jgi:DNA-binding NarL/FixJ family response regulator
MARKQNVKILLADDQKLIRDILRALIENQTGMSVVGQAENGRTALELTGQLKPDVVIMDIHMPDLNGIDATRRIVAEFPDTKVIALSMHSDKQFVDAMLKAGASGYLLKDRSFEEVVPAIRSVVTHHIYLCTEIDCTVAKDIRKITNRKKAPPLPT